MLPDAEIVQPNRVDLGPARRSVVPREDVPRVVTAAVPRGADVLGRVANVCELPVDDCRQMALIDQHVVEPYVAVHQRGPPRHIGDIVEHPSVQARERRRRIVCLAQVQVEPAAHVLMHRIAHRQTPAVVADRFREVAELLEWR